MRRIGAPAVLACFLAAWPTAAYGAGMQDGCPSRAGYRLALQHRGVRVTVVRYGPYGEGERYVWRACRVGSGRDTIVLRSDGTWFGNGVFARVAGAGEGVVAFVRGDTTRYDGCNRDEVLTVDVDTGAVLRNGPDDWCGLKSPPPGTHAVVTATGGVAWVRDHRFYMLRATNTVESRPS